MWCIDATNNMFDQGRMINDAEHGSPYENVHVKIFIVDHRPHLCIFALKDIHIGDELRYDYGIANLPWRKKSSHPQKASKTYNAEEVRGRQVEENKAAMQVEETNSEMGQMDGENKQAEAKLHKQQERKQMEKNKAEVQAEETHSEMGQMDGENTQAEAILHIQQESKEMVENTRAIQEEETDNEMCQMDGENKQAEAILHIQQERKKMGENKAEMQVEKTNSDMGQMDEENKQAEVILHIQQERKKMEENKAEMQVEETNSDMGQMDGENKQAEAILHIQQERKQLASPKLKANSLDEQPHKIQRNELSVPRQMKENNMEENMQKTQTEDMMLKISLPRTCKSLKQKEPENDSDLDEEFYEEHSDQNYEPNESENAASSTESDSDTSETIPILPNISIFSKMPAKSSVELGISYNHMSSTSTGTEQTAEQTKTNATNNVQGIEATGTLSHSYQQLPPTDITATIPSTNNAIDRIYDKTNNCTVTSLMRNYSGI